MDKYLTNSSKNKLNKLVEINKLGPRLTAQNLCVKKLLDKFLATVHSQLDVKPGPMPDINQMKKLFIDFDKKFNAGEFDNKPDTYIDSKFVTDIKKMDTTFCFRIQIRNSVITVNTLSQSPCSKYVATIIHALHMFCHTFDYNYNGLTINICLDTNKRDVGWGPIEKVLADCKSRSTAFNVSGVTQRQNKFIILTKKEEIVKLLYHELVHYIGLDHELVGKNVNFGWAISTPSLNVSEAYTEFVAIVLNAAYVSARLATVLKVDTYGLYINILQLETAHSVYLTAKILCLYGYTDNTVGKFFNGDTEKNYSPIYIWEYVVLRTQLMLNLVLVCQLVDRVGGNTYSGVNWAINNVIVDDIVDVMKVDNKMIELLKYYVQIIGNTRTGDIVNMSYTVIELDWNLL